MQQNVGMLSTQEKQAKKAGQDAFEAAQVKKEKAQKHRAKMAAMQRQVSVSSHNENVFKEAEKKLLASKSQLQKTESDILVEKSFQKGYFEARGMAQEKKVKEVKLKKMVMKHRDYMESREAEEKTGEIGRKKREQDHARKVLTKELHIEESKERLAKLKNDKMRHELNDQAMSYDQLSKDESKEMTKLENDHKMQIVNLKRSIRNLDSRIDDEKEQFQMADQVAQDTKQEREKELERAHEQQADVIREMKAETRKIIESIVLSATQKRGDKKK